MTRMHGIIFAYGKCPKLQTLVEQRVADSIPYAARYRIVDFGGHRHSTVPCRRASTTWA